MEKYFRCVDMTRTYVLLSLDFCIDFLEFYFKGKKIKITKDQLNNRGN